MRARIILFDNIGHDALRRFTGDARHHRRVPSQKLAVSDVKNLNACQPLCRFRIIFFRHFLHRVSNEILILFIF